MARMSKKKQFERLGDFTSQIIRNKQDGTPIRMPTKDGSRHYTPKIKTVGESSEKAVQKECKNLLKRMGCICFVTTTGLLYSRYGKAYNVGTTGLGDIVACLPNGKYAEIECKARNGGKVSYEQLKRQKKINSINGIYIVVCSAEELEQKLLPHLDQEDFWDE